MSTIQETSENLLRFCGDQKYATIYADPPWRFQNRTGKVAPEHKRLNRYETMELEDIMALPVAQVAAEKSHLYLWVPNALLPDGLAVMKAWGFEYKGNIIWEKVRKDGEPDGRGVGFYFRNVTEILLFGVRGGGNRTLPPARSQVNLLRAQKREHSRKPDEFIPLIDALQGRFLSCLPAGTGRAGPCGAIRPQRNMNPHGIPIKTTRKNRKTAGRRELPAPDDPKNRADRAVPVGQNIGKTAVRFLIARPFCVCGPGRRGAAARHPMPGTAGPVLPLGRSFPGRGESGSIQASGWSRSGLRV